MTFFSPLRAVWVTTVWLLAGVPTAGAQDVPKAPADAAACNVAAKAWFVQAHPKPRTTVLKNHTRQASYKAQFGAQSRHCYVLEDVVIRKADGAVARQGRRLFTIDAADRSQLGRYVGPDKPVSCEFGGKPCADAAEWGKLAEARMKQ